MIDSWTTATASAAFLLYTFSLISRIRSTPNPTRLSIKIDALAWLTLVVHVGFAFHEHHQWSHAAALAHVADETEQTLGLRWGGGIYFNHVLLLLWPIAIWRHWRRPNCPGLNETAIDRMLDIYIALMWVSATLLFGSTAFRILGTIGFGLISLVLWQARWRRRAHSAENPVTT